MNAGNGDNVLVAGTEADPLARLHLHSAAFANLAFGSITRSPIGPLSSDRHLALLPTEALELDLSDPAQRQIGNYELLEWIGEGGMGVVYRARQSSLDREVAIKLLAAGPWASREFVERFRREAQNAARMQHPNIVGIYEVGSAEELHFYSMLLIHGPSLAAVLERDGHLAPKRAAMLLRTVAEAVDYAHRLGVLHLDLKPANVLIDENGTPHVADFGLARRLEHGLAADYDEISGTPSYMAPEQAQVRSQRITTATDIWGLGAILYEVAVGRPPFLGESAQATLRLVVEGTVRRPRHHVPNLPLDLEAIILRCIQREPAQRYATARALADDLGRFIEHRAVQARRLNATQLLWRWAKRQPYLAVLGLLFTLSLVTGFIGVASQWQRAETNAHRVQTTLWNQRRDATEKLFEGNNAFMALPQLAANLSEEEAAGAVDRVESDRTRVGVALAHSPHLIDVIGTRIDAQCVALSPDANLAAIAGVGDQDQEIVQLIDLASHRKLWQGVTDATLRELAFSRDGARLVGTAISFPMTIRPSGSNMVLLDASTGLSLAPSRDTGLPEFDDVTYDADGSFAVLHNSRLQSQLFRTSDWKALGPPFASTANGRSGWRGYQLGAEARFFATSENDFSLLRLIDPFTGKQRFERRFDPALSAWATSLDGRWLAMAQENGDGWLLNTSDLTLHPLTRGPVGRVWMLRFSSDSEWLVAGGSDGSATVWETQSQRLAATPIQTDDKVLGVLTDHESRLLFTVNAKNNSSRVWRLPDFPNAMVRALELPSRPTHGSAVERSAIAFAPQRELYASVSRDGELRVWRLPPQASQAARAPPQAAESLYFDSKHIVTADANIVQVTDVSDGRLSGPLITLPQPVGFAALSADGSVLLTTNGRALDLWDWRNAVRRTPTVVLVNTPMRLALAANGNFAAVSWSNHHGDHVSEFIETIDLRSGHVVARAEATSGSALFGLRFDSDGRNLIAWSLRGVSVYDPATLTLRYASLARGDPPARVADVATSGGQNTIAASVIHDNGIRELCVWDEMQGTLRRCEPLLRGSLISADAHRIYTHDDVRDRGGRLLFALPPTRQASFADGPVVANPNGTLIAIATRQGVLLVDGHDGHPIGPELADPLESTDAVTQLVWASGTNGALLARTRRSRWLYWHLPADTRRVDEISAHAHLLALNAVPNFAPTLATNLSSESLDLLHRTDVEPAIQTAALSAPAARWIDDRPIVPRTSDTAPELLDLTAFYAATIGGLEPKDNFDPALSLLGGLPTGETVRIPRRLRPAWPGHAMQADNGLLSREPGVNTRNSDTAAACPRAQSAGHRNRLGR